MLLTHVLLKSRTLAKALANAYNVNVVWAATSCDATSCCMSSQRVLDLPCCCASNCSMLKADWQHLSDELWIEVFAKLQPDQPHDNQLSPKHGELLTTFPDFYHLPCVCKKFQTVFKQCQDLHNLLYIACHVDGNSLPDLLRWNKQYKKSVHKLVACCGSPFTEVALATLLSLGDEAPELTSAHLQASDANTYAKLHDSVVPGLVHFPSLTTISLDLFTHGNPSPADLLICLTL